MVLFGVWEAFNIDSVAIWLLNGCTAWLFIITGWVGRCSWRSVCIQPPRKIYSQVPFHWVEVWGGLWVQLVPGAIEDSAESFDGYLVSFLEVRGFSVSVGSLFKDLFGSSRSVEQHAVMQMR